MTSKTKNELFREMIRNCSGNLRFDYVKTDSWYSAVENMLEIKQVLNTNFIMVLKSNRKVALCKAAKTAKGYHSISSLQLG